MGQAPELGVHGQRLPDYHYPDRGIQHSGFVHPERQIEGVPDSQQRSGFIEWGKEFVRQISFSEHACRFSWYEDIKVDVLDERLAGTAQKYYRRQLENPVDFNSECLTAASDGDPLRITNQGSVVITVKALGVRNTVRLLDVQYAENLKRYIISYGGVAVMDVDRGNDVFFVGVYDDKFRGCGSTTDGIMTVLARSEHESD
uniref:AlNc14C29G2761 protein n=1 Tax=Albugo laibachii Nc14 TaxID=890382 RepID=F0W7E5_9STRA|nr:AlNc14C29G2761 [Albugo laibachii Nc14]|eukprot:CCA17045.1 AlNc14C29G2761 [Albugo laibachii Nc14]